MDTSLRAKDTFEHLRSNSTSKPNGRSGHCMVCSGSYVYVWGGYVRILRSSNTFAEQNDLWRFDILEDEWCECEVSGDVPEEGTLSCGCALYKGIYMLIYGGTGVPFGHFISNRLYMCDLSTFEFTKIQCDPELPERYGSAMTIVDDILYIHGGSTGLDFHNQMSLVNLKPLGRIAGFPEKIAKLVLKTVTFTSVPLETIKTLDHSVDFTFKFQDKFTTSRDRFRHTMVHYKGYLFILGRPMFDLLEDDFIEIMIFNIQHQYCRILQHSGSLIPPPILNGSIVQTLKGSKVLLINGLTGQGIAANYLSDVWSLDLETVAWSITSIKMSMRQQFQTAAINEFGECYVFGGKYKVGEKVVRHAEIFRVCLSPPPSLLSMCVRKLRKLRLLDGFKSSSELASIDAIVRKHMGM